MATKPLKTALTEAIDLPGNTIRTGTYTVTATDYLVIMNTVSATKINLPTATGSNKLYKIKNIGAGVTTVDGSGAELIDSAQTKALNQWDSLEIFDYALGKWLIT